MPTRAVFLIALLLLIGCDPGDEHLVYGTMEPDQITRVAATNSAELPLQSGTERQQSEEGAEPHTRQQKPTVSVVHTLESAKFSDLLVKEAKEQAIKLDADWIDQKEFKVRLLRSAEKHATSDAVLVPADHLGLNAYVHYSEIPDKYFSKGIPDELKSSVMVDGALRGIPVISGNHLLLYYNRQLVKESPADWQDIEAQAEALPPDTGLIGWSFMEMYWFVPFVTAFGEDPVIDNRPNLDSEAVKKALEYVWRLSQQNLIDKDCSYSCTFDKFTHGKLAYTINGIWAYDEFKALLGDKLGVAALPPVAGHTMRPYFSSYVLAFPDNALSGPKRDELLKLAALVQSQPFQHDIWTKLHDLPVHKQVIKEVISSQSEDLDVILHALSVARPLPTHPNMTVIWEAMLKGYTRYGSGAMTAEQASSFMQRLAERSIVKEAQ